ncbi:DUF4349 domain-containing protein [Streptomyces rochei]|uniref:DUF4349 domain-containing protein n=1 Tax=Streptomyces TaxID=1883 RepID=UPI000FBD0219|nr:MULTISPECIES: DUF4349 domain-containing protein [Streptomyces]RSS12167.1 DUF4349 domain-containing protein [Streptomyces sp. WAC08401]RSS31589.1 DUF4349 domain-containing protein [Streptomyces sp. WAC08452]
MRRPRSLRPVPALAAVLLAASLALTGCGAGGDDSGGSGADSAAKEAAPSAASDRQGAAGGGAEGTEAAGPPKTSASHIVRTASLTVQVEDVPEALDEARARTENAGGYVGDETTRRDGDGHERTRVVLRVPVASYQDVLDDLEGTGKLVQRSAKAEDVTDQVVDVESRIKSQRASVARVRELMDRATKLSDVVTLEGELSSRQAELEALLARQASLKDRTGLATITLSLSETPVEPAEKDEDPGFTDALAGGWDAFVTMLRWVMLVVGAVLPFAAVAALLALLWLRVVRPRLPRRTAPASAAPVTVPSAASAPLPTARPVPDSAPRREPGGRD